MTVEDAVQRFGLEALALPDPKKELCGVYCGDLLSWVMTRLRGGNAWITIMNNVNVVAVASLSDAACVILTESAEVDDAVIARANEQGVNLLRSERTSFEVCVLLGSEADA